MERIMSKLGSDSSEVLSVLPEVLRLVSSLSEAQLEVFGSCLRIMERVVEEKVEGVAPVAVLGHTGNREDTTLSSDVSTGSSASSPRARRRALARARKQAVVHQPPVDKVSSNVTYSPEEQVTVETGYCYLTLLREHFRAGAERRLGATPTFEQVLELPEAWLDECWQDLRASKVGTMYHVGVVGPASARVCLATVSYRRHDWPASSIGASLAAIRLQLSQVWYDKAPQLLDRLAGSERLVGVSSDQFQHIAHLKAVIADHYGFAGHESHSLMRVSNVKSDCVGRVMQALDKYRPVSVPNGVFTTRYGAVTEELLPERWFSQGRAAALLYKPTEGSVKIRNVECVVPDVLYSLQSETLPVAVEVVPTLIGRDYWGLKGSEETCSSVARLHGWTMVESWVDYHIVRVV